MINIEEYLKESKPDISDSTVSAYTLNLHKLHDRLHGKKPQGSGMLKLEPPVSAPGLSYG